MRVDIHNHFFPGNYMQILEERGIGVKIKTDADGRPYVEEEGTRLFTLTGPMVNLEERFTMMDREGIDVQVMSMTSPNVYAFAPEDSIKVARMVNDEYNRIKETYPDRIRVFASVPLGTGAEIEELDRAIVNLGMDGIIVGTNIHGKTLDDPAFDPFWRRVDELQLPVFVHPMTPIVGTKGMETYALVPMVGFMFDTTLAFIRLVWTGFLEKYPRIRFIACHAGGALPYLFGRFNIGYDAYAECRQVPEYPSEYLKRLFYDTISYHPPALRCLADSVGVSQLIMGSDYPHVIGDAARVMRSIEEAGFTEEEREDIYWRNARDRLGIALP